ncbi:hypothetical protein MOQ72_32770 [Saccharopolyspora sp. K220]|uniref:hypothetical protein n=1 Tax=Saccharopolyspora soli TaxID=2926618 RepID=UPI001F588687|nr:hypothetical protein [Saccharopolyspora soli]MCI2422216.1 hypothetical protein [Saccharopolyspora soli]
MLIPLGFLLALLAAAVLPLAGVSCGADTHGLIRICYPGWGAVSGTPNITSPYVTSPDPATIVGPAATLPTGIRLFAALTTLVLLAGAASALVPNTYRRVAVGATATAVSLVLLVATAVLAAAHAGSVYVYVDASSWAWLGIGDGAGVSGGFWLALVLVVGTGVVVLSNISGLRSARADADLRMPGLDA